MKKYLIILPLLFLIGCYTAPHINSTPVSRMGNQQLEAEYLNLSSEISTLEMELYSGAYQPVQSSVPIIALSAAGDRKKQVNSLRSLKRRLNEVQLEKSRRASGGLSGYR